MQFIKLYEEFNNSDHEDLAVKLLAQANTKKDIKWIEPITKDGKLNFENPDEEKGKADETLTFETEGHSVSIDFTWYWDYRAGNKGSYDVPDDPDEVYLIDIDVEKLDVWDAEGNEIAHFDRGLPEEAAWLLLYNLLGPEGDRSTRAKAEKLTTKLNWKK